MIELSPLLILEISELGIYVDKDLFKSKKMESVNLFRFFKGLLEL